MVQIAKLARGFGRRRLPRLQLGMPARLVTLDRTYTVELENLSQAGARITLPAPDDFVVCILRWMDQHAFADVVWRDELAVGLQFDKLITVETLEATGLFFAAHLALARQGEPSLHTC